MIAGVADTHGVIWYLSSDRRLSATALRFVREAETRGDQIGVSSISLAEVVYLEEKGRVRAGTLDAIAAALDDTSRPFVEVPFDHQVAAFMGLVLRREVPDMPDRIIAATALSLGVPLISRDGRIRLSAVPTIW